MDWSNFRFKRFKFLSDVLKKSAKIGVGASATVVLGVVVYNKLNANPSNKVWASWTTNYEPDRSRPWDHNWDRRDPASLVQPSKSNSEKDQNDYNNRLAKSVPKASRHLILIRHGQYFTNGKVDTERILTALGRTQADLTGIRLKELDLAYTSLTSSTMTRAIETAKLINQHLPTMEIVYDDSLQEGAPIPPEPKTGNYRPEKHQYYQDGARIESAFRKYFHRADQEQTEDSFEIIVCHSNVIRYFICRVLQFPAEAWLRFSLAHASLTHVVMRPNGRVSVRAIGDHGHMPRDAISYQ